MAAPDTLESPLNGGEGNLIDVEEDPNPQYKKEHNTLFIWGNKTTMNLNHLVLENIVQSPYYRNKLSTMKMLHELIDEIYFNVNHLEPWEKGTRKTTGQTGMCGGVRGVGAGGVVSTPFCIMYRLFMLRLTRKQVYTMLNHADSPYIRGVGFMYIRFCLQPTTFWDWYEPYLEDEEQIDPRAGGGDSITIGQMVKMFLTKLEWYCTLFPRIPVPAQKELEVKLREHDKKLFAAKVEEQKEEENCRDGVKGDKSTESNQRDRSRSRNRNHRQTPVRRDRSGSGGRPKSKSRSTTSRRKRSRSRSARAHHKHRLDDGHHSSAASKRSKRSRSPSASKSKRNDKEIEKHRRERRSGSRTVRHRHRSPVSKSSKRRSRSKSLGKRAKHSKEGTKSKDRKRRDKHKESKRLERKSTELEKEGNPADEKNEDEATKGGIDPEEKQDTCGEAKSENRESVLNESEANGDSLNKNNLGGEEEGELVEETVT